MSVELPKEREPMGLLIPPYIDQEPWITNKFLNLLGLLQGRRSVKIPNSLGAFAGASILICR